MCMSESLVWNIITQQATVTKMKNQMNNRKHSSPEMASIARMVSYSRLINKSFLFTSSFKVYIHNKDNVVGKHSTMGNSWSAMCQMTRKDPWWLAMMSYWLTGSCDVSLYISFSFWLWKRTKTGDCFWLIHGLDTSSSYLASCMKIVMQYIIEYCLPTSIG